MPEFPFSVILNSPFSSKSAGSPPFHVINELVLSKVSGVISPTKLPFSTFQYLASPSQLFSVFPSKIDLKPFSF